MSARAIPITLEPLIRAYAAEHKSRLSDLVTWLETEHGVRASRTTVHGVLHRPLENRPPRSRRLAACWNSASTIEKQLSKITRELDTNQSWGQASHAKACCVVVGQRIRLLSLQAGIARDLDKDDKAELDALMEQLPALKERADLLALDAETALESHPNSRTAEVAPPAVRVPEKSHPNEGPTPSNPAETVPETHPNEHPNTRTAAAPEAVRVPEESHPNEVPTPSNPAETPPEAQPNGHPNTRTAEFAEQIRTNIHAYIRHPDLRDLLEEALVGRNGAPPMTQAEVAAGLARLPDGLRLKYASFLGMVREAEQRGRW